MKIYIGATRQNDGKTIVSLGLLNALRTRTGKIGYIKPVGQHYVKVGGHKIDEDAILMKEIYKLEDDLWHMSPIAVPQGFTEEYILHGKKEILVKSIEQAYTKVSANKDITIIEGTGHAGVGAVFDMSNAEVAKIIGSKVLLVSCGGIGKPIDEIMLNKSLFDMNGVELIGVVVNKIFPEKFERIKELVKQGLAKQGIELLGAMPFKQPLSNPTLGQLLEEINGELISGEKGLSNSVNKIVIGDMPAHEELDYFSGGALLITPGNREDLMLAAMSSFVTGVTDEYRVSGIILTCGIYPHKTITRLISQTDIPVIAVKDDTFSTASKISSLIVKIRSTDTDKIKATEELIEQYVDVDRLLEKLKE
ncbi:MAG: AAA family ATPase [Candidatus Omnitrophica bacterium]|nr:AAA family ATPase [Candidatus Omnitrophota bacterium]